MESSSVAIGYTSNSITEGIAIGRSAIAHGVSSIAIGQGATFVPSQAIEVGRTGLKSGQKTLHIGNDLKHQCDLNIGDFITGDNATGTVTVPGSLISKKGFGVKGLTVTQVSCDVCATDEEVSMRGRIAVIKKKLVDASSISVDSAAISPEEQQMLDEYSPPRKPGFNWKYEEGLRSICMDCIFESAFDFSAQMRLAKYREDRDVEYTTVPQTRSETLIELNDNNVSSPDNVSSQSTIAEMRSQISQLTDTVNVLLDAVKKLSGATNL